jgi:thymidylate synthase
MTNNINYIQENNLSEAWAKAFLKTMEPGFTEIAPLIVTVKGFTDGIADEVHLIRNALDDALLKQGKSSCDTIASTIFPQSLWNPNRKRQLLYDRYTNIQPRITKCPANKFGIYFNRLIAFENGDDTVNQLEHIIETWHQGNHRRSALQASIFDPRKDHKHSRQRGFPCLQQVVFAPQGPNGEDGFAIIGFMLCSTFLQRRMEIILAFADSESS